MAKKLESDGLVMPVEHLANMPKLVVPLGRGKTGKTVFVRWAAERALQSAATGDEVVIADGDRTNAALAAYFPEVSRPASADDDDVVAWLNELVEAQVQRRYTAFVDLGGGDLVLKRWAKDLGLVEFLEAHRIVPVALHFLGADRDDLAYLRDIEEDTRFQPSRTALVLNEGTVPVGRSIRSAFERIESHIVFKSVLDRGAIVIRMPRLSLMNKVEWNRISFAAAASGGSKADDGQWSVGLIGSYMVRRWLREMDTAFAPISDWL